MIFSFLFLGGGGETLCRPGWPRTHSHLVHCRNLENFCNGECMCHSGAIYIFFLSSSVVSLSVSVFPQSFLFCPSFLEYLFIQFLNYILFNGCGNMCACARADQQSPEENTQELVPSFCLWVLGTELRLSDAATGTFIWRPLRGVF